LREDFVLRYLLITHIAYAHAEDGSAVTGSLWAEDLRGLVASMGPVTVAAPRVSVQELLGWGPGVSSLTEADGIKFVALPVPRGKLRLGFGWQVRQVLGRAVREADLVHSSNLFDPYTPLYFGHDLATRLGKKTLFVVAEDFYDMLNWEWVRPTLHPVQKLRRQRALRVLDEKVRKRVATASLTFLHTPAAVERYREYAANGIAIRQPVHELDEVVGEAEFAAKRAAMLAGEPLKLVVASRMEALKGVDFLLRAVALLKRREVRVQLRLLGSGKMLEDYKQLAERLGIADAALFVGSVAPGAGLRGELNAAHVFLMPHLTSDFGRAFFDAMAAGTPVIAFRSIASQDTVRDRVDGLLVANANVESLADGIAQFDADREFLVRCAGAARERARLNTKSEWNRLRTEWIRELL
jgi:glycosyltransferase involved in cell wall biosynthesis